MAKYQIAPLKGSFMLASIIMFLISVFWIKNLPFDSAYQWAWAIGFLSVIMFASALISMTYGPAPDKLYLEGRTSRVPSIAAESAAESRAEARAARGRPAIVKKRASSGRGSAAKKKVARRSTGKPVRKAIKKAAGKVAAKTTKKPARKKAIKRSAPRKKRVTAGSGR
jgi:hypothetical protein